MYRAAVAAIVFTLVTSPSATLLCRTWCDVEATSVPAADCHHDEASALARVAQYDVCERLDPGGVVFVGERTARIALTPTEYPAVAVPRYLFAVADGDDRRPLDAVHDRALEPRLLSTVLRL